MQAGCSNYSVTQVIAYNLKNSGNAHAAMFYTWLLFLKWNENTRALFVTAGSLAHVSRPR